MPLAEYNQTSLFRINSLLDYLPDYFSDDTTYENQEECLKNWFRLKNEKVQVIFSLNPKLKDLLLARLLNPQANFKFSLAILLVILKSSSHHINTLKEWENIWVKSLTFNLRSENPRIFLQGCRLLHTIAAFLPTTLL